MAPEASALRLSRREVEHTNIQICMVRRRRPRLDATAARQMHPTSRSGGVVQDSVPYTYSAGPPDSRLRRRVRTHVRSLNTFAIRLQAQGRRAGLAAGMKQTANSTGNKGARALARQTRAIERSPYFLTSLTGLSCTPAPACETNPMGCCPVIV